MEIDGELILAIDNKCFYSWKLAKILGESLKHFVSFYNNYLSFTMHSLIKASIWSICAVNTTRNSFIHNRSNKGNGPLR